MNISIDTMNRPSWDEIFIDTCRVISKKSCCLKVNTACVITYNTQIICHGHNGTFSHDIECDAHWYGYFLRNVYDGTSSSILYNEYCIYCVDILRILRLGGDINKLAAFHCWIHSDEFRILHRKWSYDNEVHAECNALAYLSKFDTRKCIMYTLYSPCDACAKEIINYKNVISEIRYLYLYHRGENSIRRMSDHGVICTQLNL